MCRYAGGGSQHIGTFEFQSYKTLGENRVETNFSYRFFRLKEHWHLS